MDLPHSSFVIGPRLPRNYRASVLESRGGMTRDLCHLSSAIRQPAGSWSQLVPVCPERPTGKLSQGPAWFMRLARTSLGAGRKPAAAGARLLAPCRHPAFPRSGPFSTPRLQHSTLHEIPYNLARRFPLYGVEADGFPAKAAQRKEPNADTDKRTSEMQIHFTGANGEGITVTSVPSCSKEESIWRNFGCRASAREPYPTRRAVWRVRPVRAPGISRLPKMRARR
jgi:hypothetical protein